MEALSIKLDHIRLDVVDVDVASVFYMTVLGLETVVRYEVGDRVILQLGPGGLPAGVELWQENGLAPRAHPTQHVAFSVSDVSAFVERAVSAGYTVLEQPFRIGAETVAFLADADGHRIELNDFRGRGVAEAGT